MPDLNWCYGYMTSDSYDWINNGLFWAGEPVVPSLRPPGLPLIIAALWKLGALSWLPIVNYVFLGISTVALYLLLRERHDALVSAVACWFFFANDCVQDLAKYVMAETYGTPFLVLAALAFVRAKREPRWYLVAGGALGIGMLFSYAAVPAAVGLGVAIAAVSRDDVKRADVWKGVLAGGFVPACWLAFRWWYYHSHPIGPRHGVEALLRPSLSNLPFYGIAGPALLGLLPLPLYVTGAWKLWAADAPARRYRAAAFGPLTAVLAFWLFFYDWADKRFLLYILPFLVCFLAEGLEALRTFARRGRIAAATAGAMLGGCVLWNQIRYPSYGFYFLALTPEHFLEARMTSTPAQKTELHLRGARVVRLHESFTAAFSRSLFDWRVRAPDCLLSDPSYTCLGTLKKEADRILRTDQPIGLFTPRGWPADYYASINRMGNALLRQVTLPSDAEIVIGGVEKVPGADFSRPPFVAHCGPYALARVR